jgi:4-amino-4-deoxy-L-arabinose transferase-like glycosyltransferase
MFVPFLGGVHLFDWDEINFAENAREMIVTGDYLNVRVDFEVFYEKPPLFLWMQALSMHIFGVNEFAARFPNAMAGLCTMIVLFNIGQRHFSTFFGLVWAFAYSAGILSFMYFKSGIIDPWFNFFIFNGIYQFIRFVNAEGNRNKFIILSALSIGLGILTKGPVALLVFLLVGFFYLVFNRFRLKINIQQILLYGLMLMLSGGFWFILQIVTGHWQTVVDFFVYQVRLAEQKDAGHGGFPGYHFVMIFVGLFPLSILSIKAFRKKHMQLDAMQELIRHFMVILFWVIMILFSVVQTKIIHYSSMAYFPVSFLAALFVWKWMKGEVKISLWQNISLAVIASIYMLALVLIPYFMMDVDHMIEMFNIKDLFVLGNLQANVSWSLWDSFPVLLLLVALLGFYIMQKRNVKHAVGILFLFTTLFTNVLLTTFIPKVEPYSQGAAIEFYESKKGEDCYIRPLGFKSYAHLFYHQKQVASDDERYFDQHWLIDGDIDKPVYFVVKVHRLQGYLDYFPNLEVMYEKNGFVFLKRKDQNDL